jgi:hypothetical protein
MRESALDLDVISFVLVVSALSVPFALIVPDYKKTDLVQVSF